MKRSLLGLKAMSTGLISRLLEWHVFGTPATPSTVSVLSVKRVTIVKDGYSKMKFMEKTGFVSLRPEYLLVFILVED